MILKRHILISALVLVVYLLIPTLGKTEASLAAQDYQDYASSKFASSNYNELVRSGIEAFHSGDYDVAQNSLYKAFNSGCESPIVVFMLALINEYKESYYSSLEYYLLAQKNFEKANKGHRFSVTFNENYGRAMYHSGKTEEAMPFLKRAGKTTKSFWLLKLLGMLAYEKGDSLNAVSYLERAVRINSGDVDQAELVYIYGLLAKLFLYKGEKDGAHRYYQKVIELDPNNADAQQFMRGIEKSYRDQKTLDLMDVLKES